MTVAYDADGDEHYNCISAFHKSIRGSDPQATVLAPRRRGEERSKRRGEEKREAEAERVCEDVGLLD